MPLPPLPPFPISSVSSLPQACYTRLRSLRFQSCFLGALHGGCNCSHQACAQGQHYPRPGYRTLPTSVDRRGRKMVHDFVLIVCILGGGGSTPRKLPITQTVESVCEKRGRYEEEEEEEAACGFTYKHFNGTIIGQSSCDSLCALEEMRVHV